MGPKRLWIHLMNAIKTVEINNISFGNLPSLPSSQLIIDHFVKSGSKLQQRRDYLIQPKPLRWWLNPALMLSSRLWLIMLSRSRLWLIANLMLWSLANSKASGGFFEEPVPDGAEFHTWDFCFETCFSIWEERGWLEGCLTSYQPSLQVWTRVLPAHRPRTHARHSLALHSMQYALCSAYSIVTPAAFHVFVFSIEDGCSIRAVLCTLEKKQNSKG